MAGLLVALAECLRMRAAPPVVLCFGCAIALFIAGCRDGDAGPAGAGDTLKQGWQQYRLSEFRSAIATFERIRRTQRPGSELYLQALYGEAACWNNRRDGRDSERASTLYRELIHTAPAHPLASWSALDLVKIRHLAPADQEIDYPNLIREYEEVHTRYPGTPAGTEAFLYSNSLSLALADAEGARDISRRVESHLTSHPATPFLSQFHEILAGAAHRTGDENSRLRHLSKAMETRESLGLADDRATTYWQIAYAAEFDAGNLDLAREYYRRLITEYPQDIRVFGARKAIERMDAVEVAARAGVPPAAEWTAIP